MGWYAVRVPSAFAHGVGSFDPTPDGVLLWTRLSDGAERVRWTVARDEQLHDVVASGEASTGPEQDHTVTLTVDGLDPATTYFYCFDVDGSRSDVGRTRTLPTGALLSTRIGVMCCARFSEARFTVYRALAERDVDLIVHLGDYIYEDGKERGEGRPLDPPGEVYDLNGYRARYAQHRSDPDSMVLHARHPMAVIWDDHEFSDNAWMHGAGGHDPDEHGDWEDRKAAALQAHHEWLPLRLAAPDDLASAWRSLVLGDLVEIILTETRVAGRDEQAGVADAPPPDDPDRSLLGAAQREWLHERLRSSPARWVVLASGTVVSDLRVPLPGDGGDVDRLLPDKYAIHDGRGMNTDQWDGYLVERDGLSRAAASRTTPLVVLSGDIHSAWAIEGEAWVEAVCPPAATSPFGVLAPGAGQAVAKLFAAALDHVQWVDASHHGFLELVITPGRVELQWFGVDLEDEGAVVEPVLLAHYRLLPEAPRLHRVSERRSPARKAALGVAGAATVFAGAAAVVRQWFARR